MESTPQLSPAPTAPTQTQPSGNDNWVWIVVGLVGLYIIYSKRKKTESEAEKDGIASYEDFAKTNLGRSLAKSLSQNRIELGEDQIKDLDGCFKGLTKTERKVLKKACNYASKDSLARTLSKSELAIFKPLRQRIINCFREQRINIE